jgi:hypothetical protein
MPDRPGLILTEIVCFLPSIHSFLSHTRQSFFSFVVRSHLCKAMGRLGSPRKTTTEAQYPTKCDQRPRLKHDQAIDVSYPSVSRLRDQQSTPNAQPDSAFARQIGRGRLNYRSTHPCQTLSLTPHPASSNSRFAPQTCISNNVGFGLRVEI